MSGDLPGDFKKLVVSTLTTDFRKAVNEVTAKLDNLGENQILVKNKYVGINATDVNISAGLYFAEPSPPYDVGFESVGTIVAIGSKVKSFKINQNVACFGLGAYAEYCAVAESSAYSIDEPKPEYVGMLTSGLSAAIGLDKTARITEGETVLITAAAGGTGHIGVQWAKAAGCHVIGTCSSEKKGKILKTLGCDRVINYKTEDLEAVLAKEYPKGVDVIWETIGGKMFETCLKHLAVKGRLLVVGGISGYKSGKGIPPVDLSNLPAMLLLKAAAVQGFLLPLYAECFETYFAYLRERLANKEIKVILDDGKESTGKEFVGFEGVIRGVEHLHSGDSMGKVVARLH